MKSFKKPLAIAGALGAVLGGSPVEGVIDSSFFHPFHDPFFSRASFQDTTSSSGMTVYEKDGRIFVEAPLPGVNEDDIELTLERGVLSVTGKRTQEEDKEAKYYYRSSNQFSYRVALPDTVDQADPKASFKNGLMQIVFEKKVESQPRRIEFHS